MKAFKYGRELVETMTIESFIVNGRFFDVVIALFCWYLYKTMKKVPNNQDTNAQVKKMKVDLDTSFMELWDYVDNSIKPIRSRVEARIRRSEAAELKEQEDLNMPETKKKTGGIIRKSQLKKYGNIR